MSVAGKRPASIIGLFLTQIDSCQRLSSFLGTHIQSSFCWKELSGIRLFLAGRIHYYRALLWHTRINSSTCGLELSVVGLLVENTQYDRALLYTYILIVGLVVVSWVAEISSGLLYTRKSAVL